MRLIADIPLELDGIASPAARDARRGRGLLLRASPWGERAQRPRARCADASARVARPPEYWRDWLAAGTFPDHPWRADLQRSALALKGLTYAAHRRAGRRADDLAAGDARRRAQLGLPLHLDPRRDLHALGAAHARLRPGGARVLATSSRDAVPRPGAPSSRSCTGSAARRDLTERTLDHLGGYGGARPVRIGNGAYDQRQNDVYGALLDSIYIHSQDREGRRPTVARSSPSRSRRPLDAWRQPDQGIWEARGEPKHYVSSKLMCWVALDRGARLAATQRGLESRALAAEAIADEIRAEILERGVSERGVFRQHYDTDALDASTLLMPLVRFLPPDDERVRATVLAIADELTEHGLVLRYRVEETDDGLSGEEGTFTICSFWLVSALSEIGETERARASSASGCSRSPGRSASTRRRSSRERRAARQLPAGVHPPGADQRGLACDRRRAAGRARRSRARCSARCGRPGRPRAEPLPTLCGIVKAISDRRIRRPGGDAR